MKKKNNITIVYEEVEVVEYEFVKTYRYDKFDPKKRVMGRENKELN